MAQFNVEAHQVGPIIECNMDRRGEVSVTFLLSVHSLLTIGHILKHF